jgi:hypothetical protein
MKKRLYIYIPLTPKKLLTAGPFLPRMPKKPAGRFFPLIPKNPAVGARLSIGESHESYKSSDIWEHASLLPFCN